MKGADGFWPRREGVRASYATEARHLRVAPGRLTAHASAGRGETCGGT
ncbi:hypothetical protein ACI2LJ_07725 [Streptomyces sp. NPDC088090]